MGKDDCMSNISSKQGDRPEFALRFSLRSLNSVCARMMQSLIKEKMRTVQTSEGKSKAKFATITLLDIIYDELII